MSETAGLAHQRDSSGASSSAEPAANVALPEIFRRLRANQSAVRAGDAAARIVKLRRLKAAISRHREELVSSMHREFHKPRMEVELSEIQLVFTELNYAIRHLPQWMAHTTVSTPPHLMGTRSEIRPEPKGVVLILAAWNYPFALLFAPLVAAVASGNCVVLRGSERVPHTCEVAERIVAESFSSNEVVLVRGDIDTARTLLRLPFDHIFFTGTSEVGREVLLAAASNLTSVTLELGGKSPVIVDKAADVPTAAERIAWGKFFNGGQTCVAPDYVLVHESLAEGFCIALREKIGAFYGSSDEQWRASPDLCRIIDKRNFDRLQNALEEAVRLGAKVEMGHSLDRPNRYIGPTILSNVSCDCALMREEIFGPILPVLSYARLEEAVEFINARPKPLALYIFTRDRQVAESILNETSAGGSAVNNVAMHVLNPNLPFGGTGWSGVGKYHGRFGFEAFSNLRAVMVQGRFSPARWFYPPYERLYHGPLGWVRRKLPMLRDR
jgi:aldehyde dehydrogenase (NAD+)